MVSRRKPCNCSKGQVPLFLSLALQGLPAAGDSGALKCLDEERVERHIWVEGHRSPKSDSFILNAPFCSGFCSSKSPIPTAPRFDLQDVPGFGGPATQEAGWRGWRRKQSRRLPSTLVPLPSSQSPPSASPAGSQLLTDILHLSEKNEERRGKKTWSASFRRCLPLNSVDTSRRAQSLKQTRIHS